MSILFQNARILTMEDDKIILGELLVEDNKIAYIGKKCPKKADKIIDCEGNLLMPGFKNCHAHTAMVFARSASDDLPLLRWLNEAIFPMEARFEEGDIYYLTKAGILEYIAGGITATSDMYFRCPEIVKASEEMGIRNVLVATSSEEPVELLEERYKAWNKKDSLISYRLGIHAEYTTSKERIMEIAALANKLHAKVALHIGETQSEVNGCVKRYGATPVKFLDSLGLFNYGGIAYHSNFFNDEEIQICKNRGIDIVTCPASNAKLASGICPVLKYIENGLTVSIGTDGAGSNNSLDMFKEMYLVSALQKLSYLDASKMDGFEVLKMATVSGSKVLDLADADVLKEGKLADIIMIDLSHPSMQPLNNIAKNIVYSGSKDIVKMTMIDGKILYYNHEFLLNEDIKALYNKVQQITDRLKG